MRRIVLLGLVGLSLVGPVKAQAAETGSVEGTVTPLAWAPEVEVCVVEVQPSETCTAPAANGSYTLRQVPIGGAKIEFVPSYRSRLLKQYFDHKSSLEEATTIILNPQKGFVEKNINAALVEGGAIEGTVTAAGGGAPLPEVEVCAISVGTTTAKSCGETDAAGEYELHSLPTEKYRVGFRGSGGSEEYESWTHPTVSVTAGSAKTGVDASLVKGAQIRGSVTAAVGGGRLAGISACLFAAADTKPQQCTYSDEVGEYSFEGLPGGDYQVGFSLDSAGNDGFESQYYDGVTNRAEAATISLVAAALATGVDAALSTPTPPTLVAPAPPVASATVAVPGIAEPAPRKPRCKKPKRKKKVKGKIRCVGPGKHKKGRS